MGARDGCGDVTIKIMMVWRNEDADVLAGTEGTRGGVCIGRGGSRSDRRIGNHMQQPASQLPFSFFGLREGGGEVHFDIAGLRPCSISWGCSISMPSD